MSTSTAAPAALARSDGWKLLTKGTAAATPPTAPTPQPDGNPGAAALIDLRVTHESPRYGCLQVARRNPRF